jgi:hypothetical protein
MTSTVQLLIEHGANPLEEDAEGKIAADLVNFQSYDQVIAEALQSGTERETPSLETSEIQIEDDNALESLVLKYSPYKNQQFGIPSHAFSLSSDEGSDVVSFGLEEVDQLTPIIESAHSQVEEEGAYDQASLNSGSESDMVEVHATFKSKEVNYYFQTCKFWANSAVECRNEMETYY